MTAVASSMRHRRWLAERGRSGPPPGRRPHSHREGSGRSRSPRPPGGCPTPVRRPHPRTGRSALTLDERRHLRVHRRRADVGRVPSHHVEAGHRSANGQAHHQVRHGSAGEGQGQERVIHCPGTGAPRRQLGIHGRRPPQQEQRLVDDVRTQVEVHPASRAGVGVVLPRTSWRASGLGLPPLKPDLDPLQRPQPTLSHQVADGPEVAVPATVVERDAHPPLLLGDPAHRPRLSRGRGDRLVDDDMPTRAQRRHRQGHVGGIGRGDHDQVHVHASKELLDRPDDLGAPMPLGDEGPTLRVAGDDGDQVQLGHGLDERRMEHRPAQPVADQPDAHSCWLRRRTDSCHARSSHAPWRGGHESPPAPATAAKSLALASSDSMPGAGSVGPRRRRVCRAIRLSLWSSCWHGLPSMRPPSDSPSGTVRRHRSRTTPLRCAPSTSRFPAMGHRRSR